MLSPVLAPGTVLANGRFELARRLGSGSFGVVFEASDTHGGRVALKVLERGGPLQLYLFKQEFRQLAGLSHPNLVQLYELHSDNDTWFFTMELVEGLDAVSYVRGRSAAEATGDGEEHPLDTTRVEGVTDRSDASSPDPIDDDDWLSETTATSLEVPFAQPDRIRNVVRSLAEGLTYLHNAGILHRDIKPHNVLVTAEQRVVLLDFGVAIDRTTLADEAPSLAGTPHYMSPEQAASQPLTEASDWYSVGVLLYQFLTGVCPFEGDARRVLNEKQFVDPPPPMLRADDVPAELGELCMRLLRRDPTARPTSDDVFELLGHGPAHDAVARSGRRPRRLFVGRGAELERLREAVRGARAGEASVVLLSGPSGIGKTALLRAFIDELREETKDAVVLSGRCYEQESVPYKGLDSVVDALSRQLTRLPEVDLWAVLPHEIAALLRIFPVLQRVPIVEAITRGNEPPTLDEVSRRLGFDALKDLLRRVGELRPLIIAIDDLQWGDADSGVLLTTLLGPPKMPRVVFAATFRPEDEEHSPCLRALLPELSWRVPGRVVQTLRVAPLAQQEAAMLARSVVDGGINEARAREIARDAAGHPLFVKELARFGTRAGQAPLDRAIRARVALLPEDARRILEVVAVASQPISVAAIARVLGRKPGVQAALALLRAQRLVTFRSAHAVVAYHDRVRKAVADGIGQELLRELHRRLARAIEGEEPIDWAVVAAHYDAAGSSEETRDAALRAAEAALAALAFEKAARFFRLAIARSSGEAGELARVFERSGHALALAGRGNDAGAAFLEAAACSSDVDADALRLRAVGQLLSAGQVDRGFDVLDKLFASIGLELPRTAWAVERHLAWESLRLAFRGRGARLRDELFALSPATLRVDACLLLARLVPIEPRVAALFAKRALRLALDLGDPTRLASARSAEALHVALDGGAKATAALDALDGGARTAVRPTTTRRAHDVASELERAMALVAGGELARGERALNAIVVRLSSNARGAAAELALARSQLLLLQLRVGNWAELRRTLPEIVQYARTRDDLFCECFVRAAAGHAPGLMDDDPEQAAAYVRSALKRWGRTRADGVGLAATLALAEIDLYRADGSGDDAHRRLRARWSPLERAGLLRARSAQVDALELRGRTALAASRTTPANRARLLAEAEECADELFEAGAAGRALALFLRANVVRLRGERRGAATLFEVAARALDGVRRGLHAEVARRRATELSGAPRPPGPSSDETGRISLDGFRRPERIVSMLTPG